MTVVIDKYSIGLRGNEHCIVCGGSLHFPYLEWHGKKNIAFCMRCCKKIKRGLVADLIHINAILDLHAEGYNCLLVRQSEGRHQELLEAKNELCKQKTGIPMYELEEDEK
jgi:hypothetical protein